MEKIMTKWVIGVFLIASFSINAQAEKSEGKAPLTSGFNHIGLTVSQLDKSVSFFVEVLGWQVAGGDPDYPSVFVSDGEMLLTLWQVTHPQSAIAFNRKNNVGLHHLAFTVESFDTLNNIYDAARRHQDVVIEFAPELAYGGPAKHMMLREPSGNRLEFTHRPTAKTKAQE
jgi:lactoylglutathione lyase